MRKQVRQSVQFHAGCLQSHLDGAEGVEQVGVMSDAGAEASALVLTGFDEVYDLLPVHPGQLPHQVHHRQPPVDTTHPQVL